MNSSSRPRLHFLSRGTRHSEPQLRNATTLLPRETFEDCPEVLEHYDRFVTFREAVSEHQKAEGRALRAATEAREEYQRKIREAIGHGDDPSKIKSAEDRHKVTAEAHRAMVRESTAGMTRAARDLAYALAEHAPNLLDPAEKRLIQAASEMEADFASIRRSWGAFELAWQERRILGSVGLFGGLIQNFDPAPSFPPDVADALATLTNRLTDLDRLKSDEAHIRAERPNGVQQ